MDTTSLQDFVEKLALITGSPEQRFTYVPLPLHVQTALKAVQASVVPAGTKERDLDHITLVYAHDAPKALDPLHVDRTVKALREVAEGHAPIAAKLQGWAYFDGAMNHGKPSTALVALVDAPGLAELHVDMKNALKQAGHPAAETHGFTPHVTLAYLEHGQRVPNLPKIEGTSFTIDKVMFANRDIHGVPLTGGVGMSAAKAAAAESVDFNLMNNAGVSPPLDDLAAPVVPVPPQAPEPGVSDQLADYLLSRLRMRAGLEPPRGIIPMPWDDGTDSVGVEAAKTAAYKCDRCSAPATVKVLWAEGHGGIPSCEKHKEEIAAPYKKDDDFSGFKKIADLLPGGKGDDVPSSAFDPKEYAMGLKVEREHSPNLKIRGEISADHLVENPKYYTILQRAGLADELDEGKTAALARFGLTP